MRSIEERLADLRNHASPSRKVRPDKRKKRKDDHYVDITRLEELCETELVTIAHEAGYVHASRALLREDLIDLILGGQDAPDDPLMVIRGKIDTRVQAIGDRMLRSQMPCDLDCPQCPHRMVVECYTINREAVD